MAKEIGTISARGPNGVRLPVALTFEHQSGEGVPLLPGERPNAMVGGAVQYGARTGIWNILAVRSQISGNAAYRTTLIVKLAVVVVSGVTAALHIRARTARSRTVFGALTGLSALAALFLGVLLAG